MHVLDIVSRACVKALMVLSVLQICVVFCIIHEERPKPEHDNTTYESDGRDPATAKQIRWAESAYSYLQNLDCSQTVFANERECVLITQKSRHEVNVYLADPLPYDKYRTVIPADDLDNDYPHDAVIVLDPYPEASFGHLVLVFYLDLYIQKDFCTQEKGTLLEGGECLTLAYRRRCRDARMRKRSYARRCRFDFIPLVYREQNYYNPQQELTCRSNMAGFAGCPSLRPSEETTGLVCEPTPANPRHCETAASHVHTSCRPFETCDQAVIIAGGWNRWSSPVAVRERAWAMYHLVKDNGFSDSAIKVFYANGAQGIQKDPGSHHQHEVYPAAYKQALRSHLQTVCSSAHCAETLLVYVTGPARADASTLLWDTDNDGVASDDEMYKLEEILGDIANCKSNTVHLIADQSFSGELAKAVKRSKNHRNVAVYASSRDSEYAYGGQFTRHWTTRNHTTACMRQIFRDARKDIQESNPDITQGPDVHNLNLFGAECNVIPPFSFEEIHTDYMGCQNVPLSDWVQSQYYDSDINSASSESSSKRQKRDLGSKTESRRQTRDLKSS